VVSMLASGTQVCGMLKNPIIAVEVAIVG
jgi:hypothetical protein